MFHREVTFKQKFKRWTEILPINDAVFQHYIHLTSLNLDCAAYRQTPPIINLSDPLQPYFLYHGGWSYNLDDD